MSNDILETTLAKKLKGKLTRGSGCVCDDADIRVDGFLIEAKRRSATKSIILDKKYWEKLRKQCVKYNKMPLYVFQAGDDAYGITYLDAFNIIEYKVEHMIDIEDKTNIIIQKDDLNFVYKDPQAIAVFDWKNIRYVVLPMYTLEAIINGQRKTEEIRED